MQPTYFASFLLGENASTPAPSVAEVLALVETWLFENPYRELRRPESWPMLADAVVSQNGEKLQVLRLNDESDQTVQTFAVRFEHPDQQSRIWRTDCVITEVREPELATRFAVTVAAGGGSDRPFALRPPTSRPRIVRSIMDKFGAREGYPLKSTFFRIAANEAKPFAGFLLDPTRTIPVLFISRRNQDGRLLCNPSELADKLVGIAYVCEADSCQLSWNLTDYLDNRLNAYDGTVRVYWPRMTSNDPPYRHRWWTVRQLEATGRPIADELLQLIGTASLTRHVPGLVRWEDIERENTRRTIKRLQSSGSVSTAAFEEWLEQYDSSLASLENAQKELASMSDVLLEKEEEVRRWKQMYLQAIRGSKPGLEELPAEELVIEDTNGAIALASEDFADELEIIEGRIEKDALQFEEPELLYTALKWLATTYRNAKAGSKGCDDLDKSCRETCQFRYSAHQSDITMSMFASDYEVSYKGSKTKIKLKEHIGYGTSTEPRHTIRVAFFFDDASRKVVIGFIGQHQTTRKSN